MQTKNAVKIGNTWYKFPSLKSMVNFISGLGVAHEVDKFYTLNHCVQVFWTCGVFIRVQSRNGIKVN